MGFPEHLDLVRARGGALGKQDLLAFHAEVPPKTASRIYRPRHEWGDDAWLELEPVRGQEGLEAYFEEKSVVVGGLG